MKKQAHSLGRLFVTTVNQAQGAPIVDRAITIETEGALRRGTGLAFRAPFTRHRPCLAVVLGIWRKATS